MTDTLFLFRPAPSPSPQQDSGFTLVELLVALFIFALIGSASSFVLFGAISTRDALLAQDAQLRLRQVSHSVIKQDMAQLTAQAARGLYGERQATAFSGGLAAARSDIQLADGEILLVDFSRLGRANPGGHTARSSLSRVRYVLKAGTLVRRTHVRFNAVPQEGGTFERPLFENVTQADVRFFDGQRWRESWQAREGERQNLPKAFSLTLEMFGGTSEYLFLIEGGSQ